MGITMTRKHFDDFCAGANMFAVLVSKGSKYNKGALMVGCYGATVKARKGLSKRRVKSLYKRFNLC